MRRRTLAAAAVVAGTALLAVRSDQTPDPHRSEVLPVVARSECESAFEQAAAVDPMRDTHSDLFPAYFACNSIEQWLAADRKYPEAIEAGDPIRYAMTVCANNSQELADATICDAVSQPAASGHLQLARSGQTGLLGVPLPEGVTLVERTPGGGGADPREKYTIVASNDQIRAFYDAEMREEGWRKDGASVPNGLFYQKGPLMIGVLMNNAGNTFTLMGS